MKSRRPPTHVHSNRNELRFDITLAAAQFSVDILGNTLVVIGPAHSASAFVFFMTMAVFWIWGDARHEFRWGKPLTLNRAKFCQSTIIQRYVRYGGHHARYSGRIAFSFPFFCRNIADGRTSAIHVFLTLR
jgi:hypothetical protein